MSRFSRMLFIAMLSLFAICTGGVIGGVLYSLYATIYLHRSLEDILGHAMPYNKVVGWIGIAGMFLFFVFLLSLISNKNKGKPS
jgi:hypothetical protein